MSERKSKNRLNDTWTKDELTRSLKHKSDKKSSRTEEKYKEEIEDKYSKRERHKREERTESNHRSSSKKHESSDKKRDRDDRSSRYHDKYEKEDDRYRDKGKKDRSERKHGRDEDKYERNDDDRKHRSSRQDDEIKESRSRESKYDGNGERRHRRNEEKENYRDTDKYRKKKTEDRERGHPRRSNDYYYDVAQDDPKHKKNRQREGRDEEEYREKKRHREKKESRRREETEEEREERKRRERKERHRREKEDRDQEKGKNRVDDRNHRDTRDKKQSDGSKSRHGRDRNEESHSKTKEKEKPDTAEEYNYDDEEFEDYEDDFESDPGDNDNEEDTENTGSSVNRTTSEMEELMRAIAAENERANSAQTSRISSSKTSERFDSPFSDDVSGRESKLDTSTDSSLAALPVTTINFRSAKSKSSSTKNKRRMLKRHQDLATLIQLDTVAFDIIELAPETEYSLYIKNYGNSNTSQVSTQCMDDNLDQEIQTDTADKVEKWSQHPPHDIKACGGVISAENEQQTQQEERDRMLSMMRVDSQRLGSFLKRACRLMETILIEDEMWKKSSVEDKRKSGLSFCEGLIALQTDLAYLQGRKVAYVECSPGLDVNLVAVAFEPAATTFSTRIDRKGIVTVWDTRKPAVPEKVLVCDSSPLCCCFSPSKSYILFVGTDNGCVLAYDLREPGIHHQIVSMDRTRETVLRNPTYSTGCLSDGHSSPVVCLTVIGSSSKISTNDNKVGHAERSEAKVAQSGLAFQLASLEEAANLCIWIVVELQTESVLDGDLGLSPHGKIKLLKSVNVSIRPPVKTSLPDLPFRTFCVRFSYTDPNHFFVGTDTGHIVHCSQGVAASRKRGILADNKLLTFYNDLDLAAAVSSIDINPFQCFGSSLMLAGYNDGTLRLYVCNRELPILTWPFSTSGAAVVKCQWSTSRPSVFFVLDSESNLHIWDLVIMSSGPIKTEHISNRKVHHFSLTNMSEKSKKQKPKIALVYDSTTKNSAASLVEVHNLAPHFALPMDTNETEQLSVLLQSML